MLFLREKQHLGDSGWNLRAFAGCSLTRNDSIQKGVGVWGREKRGVLQRIGYTN